MKVALITDTHFGARNDSLLFLDFFRKFYENIFFPTLKERGITDVIHLGDVVDRRKFINYQNSQFDERDIISSSQRNGCKHLDSLLVITTSIIRTLSK